MAIAENMKSFIEENDVQFVHLAFCDMFGRLKNISIMADELPYVAENGMFFDASGIPGFTDTAGSDLILVPDIASAAVLPWRQQQGRVARVYCDIFYSDGKPFELDCRRMLRNSVKRLQALQIDAKIGLECEFYLFNLDDQGQPVLAPHDQAGYLDFAPLDKGENVRREICLSLEQMGVRPVSSHHESGPGQNEIVLRHRNPLTAAENFITFSNVAKTSAASFGLFASLLPKPLKDRSGSGLHTNIVLQKNGENAVKNGAELTDTAKHFMQGLLSHASEMAAFLNPLPGSYSRLGYFDSPLEISWSIQNKVQLLRVPSQLGAQAHMELRSPDPAMNPYIGLALLLEAGADGIEQKMPLAGECEVLGRLPGSLDEAVSIARQSVFIKNALPKRYLDQYFSHKQKEYTAMFRSGDPDNFEITHYLGKI